MVKFFTGKFIFALLIVILVSSFIINIILSKSKKPRNKPETNIEKNESKKIFGARIHQQNKNGEKILIVAETLMESTSESNNVLLENSLTTINQNGVLTNISAGYAIVSNNYENFDFSNKVMITKKTRNFILNTETLIGEIKEGNFYTNDKVDIISGNTIINGKGLDLRRNGEYIKIKGKAKLVMLLSSKNAN